jgi:type IV secretory pathway VirB10-like protein
MSIKLAGAEAVAGGLTRVQLAILGTVGVVGLGGSGALVYHLAQGPKPAAAAISTDEAKLSARADERRAHAAAAAQKLRQQDLGQGYQFDSQGNLLAATADGSDLPQNKAYQEAAAGSPRPAPPMAAIGRGIDRENVAPAAYDDDLDDGDTGRRHHHRSDDYDEEPSPADRSTLSASMLGYSTVAGATWASHRPERPVQGGDGRKGSEDAAREKETHQTEAMDRVVNAMEDSTRALVQQASSPKDSAGAGSPGSHAVNAMPVGTTGYWGAAPAPVSPGPSGAGESLYAGDAPTPAERAPQPFAAGTVGDMRIGGAVGPDHIVRQGKFLDCAIINEIRADLVDSPVIAMVSRDFVTLDGKYVLVPAGSKLLGEAGRVQNLQQERVYIKFDRIVFPDQRSAYFPVRKVPAVDQMGAVGVEGDVDRHFFLQFGAAVMLGILDGIGAAVQSPGAGANPTLRELIMARTSANFSTVIAGVIQKYANVVPTVTVPAGSKMKIFFSEDVRLSPYMTTGELSWVREPR